MEDPRPEDLDGLEVRTDMASLSRLRAHLARGRRGRGEERGGEWGESTVIGNWGVREGAAARSSTWRRALPPRSSTSPRRVGQDAARYQIGTRTASPPASSPADRDVPPADYRSKSNGDRSNRAWGSPHLRGCRRARNPPSLRRCLRDAHGGSGPRLEGEERSMQTTVSLCDRRPPGHDHQREQCPVSYLL